MQGIAEPTEYIYGNLVFTLAPHQTVVATPLQRFYLYPRQSYWNRRLDAIRFLIMIGKIQTLDDLAHWSADGIEWRASSLQTSVLVHSGE